MTLCNVVLIGCGKVGKQRAANLTPDCRLVYCVDTDLEQAKIIAGKHPKCMVATDWKKVMQQSDVDMVIIATPHKYLATIALAAIQSNKHVFIEKPAAINTIELAMLSRAVTQQRQIFVRVGFNHRYHPALQKAKQLVDENALGGLTFIRGHYGHGGRLGYETEWRAKKEFSGGGELIDQGIHLIDLARWFLGELHQNSGVIKTYFWDMAVEDTCFLTLENQQSQIAFLSASCAEWKNTFHFEVYGKQGKLAIHGLGNSYGAECLTYYKMLPQRGPPEITDWKFTTPDRSWQLELADFLEDIRLKRQPSPGLADAWAALTIIEEIYGKI